MRARSNKIREKCKKQEGQKSRKLKTVNKEEVEKRVAKPIEVQAMTNKRNTSPVNTVNQTKVPKEEVVEKRETTVHKEDRDREVQARR